MFKSQSNTKFCNRLYRNLLFNGALTLFCLVILQMVFILFYVSLSWKLIKPIVWTAHGERHTLTISYFLHIIQNIPIYKIRVESMEQTILLFYRYYILFYYKKIAVLQNITQIHGMQEGKTLWNMLSSEQKAVKATTISRVVCLVGQTFCLSFCFFLFDPLVFWLN